MKFPFQGQLIHFFEKELGYMNFTILNGTDGNKLISQLLKSKKPIAIGKIGSTENWAIRTFISQKQIDCASNSYQQLYAYSGVFPIEKKIIEAFCIEFLDSIQNFDAIAVWFNRGESSLIKKYALKAKLIELRAIEPYYYEDPWSQYLENKKILVIHPFTESIQKQYKDRSKIWSNKNCLPKFNLYTIKAPLSASITNSYFDSWIEALNYMKKEMEAKEFDVAIVGAGAYSIPLVAHAKKMGKIGIHLGGSTQILFGIKGKRWDNHEIGQKFYNDYWIRPSNDETPERIEVMEQGCYW